MIAALIVFFSNKEQKKEKREAIDNVNKNWAKAFDATELLREKEANALKYALACKNEIIAEKNERIKQLESQISMNNMVMACAKIDGSIDIEKLKEMTTGPYVCEELLYNE